MTVFKSYFSKNNTLISSNLTNNSQNPVTEISYGTVDNEISRLIFDIDLDFLKDRINQGIINPDKIVSHKLKMINTISNAQEYVGKRSYSLEIERASSFDLELFNVSEDWDEGSGYDFTYSKRILNNQASNWKYRKTDIPWASEGVYNSGTTKILGNQNFEKGSEDIDIDITDYINAKLGLTGSTGFTGTTYGLGLKFVDDLENLETIYRQAVGFHLKNTHTFYEPYIETIVDDTITDDRNYFYLNKDNYLYLYSNIGNANQNITINNVKIFDYEDNLFTTISGSSIENVSKGIYRIKLHVSSDDYPDSVLFRDEWNLTINGREKIYDNQFYLISDDNYYTFDLSNNIDIDNYFFYFWGINQKENIVAGDIRNIQITVKELYPNQDNFIPLDIEYRLFTTVGDKYELDVIPFTPVNRTSKGYHINLDTSWLIPQDYQLQLRLNNNSYYKNKESIRFTIISNDIKK